MSNYYFTVKVSTDEDTDINVECWNHTQILKDEEIEEILELMEFHNATP